MRLWNSLNEHILLRHPLQELLILPLLPLLRLLLLLLDLSPCRRPSVSHTECITLSRLVHNAVVQRLNIDIIIDIWWFNPLWWAVFWLFVFVGEGRIGVDFEFDSLDLLGSLALWARRVLLLQWLVFGFEAAWGLEGFGVRGFHAQWSATLTWS